MYPFQAFLPKIALGNTEGSPVHWESEDLLIFSFSGGEEPELGEIIGGGRAGAWRNYWGAGPIFFSKAELQVH